MRRYALEVLGICESRWNGCGLTTLSTGESIIYSGHPDYNHEHTEGVAMMSPVAAKALMQWEPISPRIMTARFNSEGRKVTIIRCYAQCYKQRGTREEEEEGFLQTTTNSNGQHPEWRHQNPHGRYESQTGT
ncbi:unnamed protein product [Trichobilharzia szidati]|nr:unnamed protein product [Trichobilharzia szidati]